MSVSTRVSFALAAPLLLVLSAAAVQAQVQDQGQAQVQNQSQVQVQNRGKVQAATLSAEDAVVLLGLNAVLPPTSACNTPTSCGPAYGACTNWSGGYPCGDPYCGWAYGCGLCNEWGQCEAGGPATSQNYETYRICFDQHGTPCTEYAYGVSAGCGC
jgi:hypothetical protein